MDSQREGKSIKTWHIIKFASKSTVKAWEEEGREGLEEVGEDVACYVMIDCSLT